MTSPTCEISKRSEATHSSVCERSTSTLIAKHACAIGQSIMRSLSIPITCLLSCRQSHMVQCCFCHTRQIRMRLEGILLGFGSNQVINQLNRIAIHSQKLRSGQPGPPASVPADILPRPRVLEAHPGRTRGMLFWTGIIHDICVCVQMHDMHVQLCTYIHTVSFVQYACRHCIHAAFRRRIPCCTL